MNTILKKYVPGLSMAFFMIIFSSCLFKIFTGDTLDGFAFYIIEVTVYLIVTAVIDEIIGQIDFKSYLSNFIGETVVLYPVTLVFAWFGHWFGFRVMNLILFTCLFLLVMALIHIYFYHMSSQDAEEINRFLREREDE